MPVSAKYYASKHVLGNVVNKSFLEETRLIGEAQAKIDGARGQLNSLISLRRSLAQTITEVKVTGISVKGLQDEITKLAEEVEKAAVQYVKIRVAEEKKIQKSQAKIAEDPLWDELESPVDFSRSNIITRPIGINSMNLDAQYFNFNGVGHKTSIGRVKSFVRNFAENLGSEAAQDLSEQAGKSVEKQLSHFEVVGTLVIAASCTHANAHVLYPIKLDVDESLMLWNRIFKTDRIDTSNPDALRVEVETYAPQEPNYLNLISGITYGSSFVGMMHLLRPNEEVKPAEDDDEDEDEDDDDTTTAEEQEDDEADEEEAKDDKSITEIAESLRSYLQVGSWLQDVSGGLGIDPMILGEVRNQLSLRKIRAHVTVASLGVLPSIKSNLVGSNLPRVVDLSDTNKRVAELEQLSEGEHDTPGLRAESARLSGRAAAIEGSRIESVLASLRQADETADQAMNLGTLLSAFDDYAEKVKRETAGVPISYYFRKVNRREVIKAFLNQEETSA